MVFGWRSTSVGHIRHKFQAEINEWFVNKGALSIARGQYWLPVGKRCDYKSRGEKLDACRGWTKKTPRYISQMISHIVRRSVLDLIAEYKYQLTG